MENNEMTPIKIERAMEQLRQEREVFNQRKEQEARWFILRITMGYTSVVLLFAVIIVSAFILFNSAQFPDFAVKSAGAALFADVVGLLIGYLSPTPRKGKYKRRLICGGGFKSSMPVESRSQAINRAKS